MNEFPDEIRNYIFEKLILKKRPAFFKLGSEGKILDYGKNMEEYGFPRIELGMPVEELIYVLAGTFPLEKGEDTTLSCIEISQGQFANLHCFNQGDFDWVLIIEAQKEEVHRRHIHEKSTELEEKFSQIQKHKEALLELSTPVIEVWDNIIVLPIIGVVDSQRGEHMMENLLTHTAERGSKFVIVDLTGVSVVDTSTADLFVRMSAAVELLGAKCILTGLSPEISMTFTTMGVELHGMTTKRSLKEGLQLALRKMQIFSGRQ